VRCVPVVPSLTCLFSWNHKNIAVVIGRHLILILILILISTQVRHSVLKFGLMSRSFPYLAMTFILTDEHLHQYLVSEEYIFIYKPTKLISISSTELAISGALTSYFSQVLAFTSRPVSMHSTYGKSDESNTYCITWINFFCVYVGIPDACSPQSRPQILQNAEGTISSPSFPFVNFKNVNCQWRIVAANNEVTLLCEALWCSG